VLKKTGSFYYHCDWHASHYVKIMLDQIFGENQFVNEIIWKRQSAHSRCQAGIKTSWPRPRQSVFRDIACAAFNIYIVNRNHEASFVADAYSSYEDKSFMVVAVNLFGLHVFTDHQLGVIVYKGRKAT
jgi:DNA modification methylase